MIPKDEEELSAVFEALASERSNEVGRAAVAQWAHGVRLLWGEGDDPVADEAEAESFLEVKARRVESKAAVLNAMTASLRLAMAADKAESDAILKELRDKKRRAAQEAGRFDALAGKPRVIRGGKD